MTGERNVRSNYLYDITTTHTTGSLFFFKVINACRIHLEVASRKIKSTQSIMIRYDIQTLD